MEELSRYISIRDVFMFYVVLFRILFGLFTIKLNVVITSIIEHF